MLLNSLICSIIILNYHCITSIAVGNILVTLNRIYYLEFHIDGTTDILLTQLRVCRFLDKVHAEHEFRSAVMKHMLTCECAGILLTVLTIGMCV